MKDDDPEKRVSELERELAGGPTFGLGVSPRRRRSPYSWVFLLVVLGVFMPTIISLVAYFVRAAPIRESFVNADTTAPTSGPAAAAEAVPQGGELTVNGTKETKTIACNDGKLTFTGNSSTYTVTGHCVSLTAGGYSNRVTVDTADALESSGYYNVITDHACNNAKITLSSYGMRFDATGHCASLAISSYDNKVTVDSVDSVSIVLPGYDCDVTYHSGGAPKVSDGGYGNTIHQG